MTLVTQATFAKICNTTRKTVTMWKKAGRLVLQGDRVDVESTAAYMKQYHPTGSPIVLSPLEIADLLASDGNKGSKGNKVTSEGNSNVVTSTQVVTPKRGAATVVMTLGEVERELLGLDWTQEFDWSTEALDQRARQAARCIGWEAVTSSLFDDGHWGGYQLRITEYSAQGVHYGAIAGGFGFELDAFDVLTLVRGHIRIREDEDGCTVTDDGEEIEIQSDLIPMLARPFGETHRR